MAKMLPCPACRKKVSEEAGACPKCGHPLAGDEKFQARRKSRRRANVATWLVALGLLCYCTSKIPSLPTDGDSIIIPSEPKAERDARAHARAAAQAAETRSKLAEAHARRDREATAEERARSAKAKTADQGDVHGAWAYMQQFVEKKLKSPSSADFPFGGHRHVTPLGDGRYKVDSYVDAQNSFGAQHRTHFEGVIKRVPSGWELESLSFRN